MKFVPLKSVASANLNSLPKHTDPNLSFLYCDVSSVTKGILTIPNEPILFSGSPSRARRIARGNDIAFSTVRPYLKSVAIVPSSVNDLIFSTGFTILTPHTNKVLPKYLYWVLQSDLFIGNATQWSNGVSYPAINVEDLMRIKVPLPTLIVQKRISKYIESETEKIELLIQKQSSLVNKIISRLSAWQEFNFWGINSKDSLSKPPKEWKVKRNKLIFEHVDAKSLTGEEELLSVSHITGVTPRSMKTVNMFEAESTVGYKLVNKDELVINTMWAWMGALGISKYQGIVSPSYDVYRIRTSVRANPMFFDTLYRTNSYTNLIKANSRGVWESRLRLYPEVFLRLHTAIPPLDVQDRLVAENFERTTEANNLINRCERAMDLLQERRTALISAAVTGQIEV